MTAPAGSDSDLPARWMLALCAAAGAGGVAIVLPHLADGVWQDEAFSLLAFSRQGFGYPFTDYSAPNNHVLFSAIMALWWNPGDAVATLRALPLVSFGASLVLFAVAGARSSGRLATAAGLVLFASSPVTESFAVQLRAYGPSWLPVCAMLLALPPVVRGDGVGWSVLYALAAACAIALLPTNALVCAVLAVWAALHVAGTEQEMPDRWRKWLVIFAGPLLGAAAYARIWPQLVEQAAYRFSPWGPADLLLHWLAATLADVWWLVPLIALGLVRLVQEALREPGFAVGGARSHLALLATTIAIVPTALVAMANPPFPRNLVPLLPVWYLLCGAALAAAWRWLFARRPALGHVVFAAVLAAAFAHAVAVHLCVSLPLRHGLHQDLCEQFYHDDYQPERTARVLNDLTAEHPMAIVTDFEGLWALRFVAVSDPAIHLDGLVHYRDWARRPRSVRAGPALYVARDRAALDELLRQAGASGRYEPQGEPGYLRVFAPAALPGS